ncbi:MAG: hypothetical protein ACREKI_06775 [Gemmatimonadota bacterium]
MNHRGAVGPHVLVAAALAAGCAGAGDPRPPYGPVDGALETTVHVLPYRVIEAAVGVFVDKGYAVRLFSPEHGYLETAFVDVTSGGFTSVWGASELPVKFRLRADHSNGGSRVVLEVLYRPRALRGAGERFETEMVPAAHPGHPEGRRILERLREALGEPAVADSV